MRKKILSLGIFLLAGAMLNTSLEAAKMKIGMTVDDLRLERWQRDRDIFTEEANKLGAEVVAVSANGDSDKQMRDAENLISQGIDLLVVIPNNGDVMGAIVDQAHQDGIKVLAYDRLLTNSDVDAYISFDNEKVGELQGEAIVEAMPKGMYFMMGGSPTDNNAKMFRAGQMKAVQPYIDSGEIVIVGDQWVKDWLPEEAMKIMENALTANDNKIDAVVASNDSTAGGAIQALAAQNMAGKVPISGQDADLAAVKRVAEGTQTVTVYKPIPKLAKEAAKLSVKMIKNENLGTTTTVNNGQKDVPAVLLEPIAVTKDNIKETIVKDGFHTEKDIYGK
ncbi:D-xylose ABC transporter substrate-binding protein [Cetobacterium somerae]|uniref:D-xylose ABC transporter substrate-binding protein n=1 Tax=Cetobacterium somerae TaxID=188913 RepID=UPI001F06CFC0|nr:D-xylose ABC transporter substrate-binding protein [Cetobacterium somerae]UPO96506.1 D-xylose ABC transporter substrate-binding protein [Cetobacterium somerae]